MSDHPSSKDLVCRLRAAHEDVIGRIGHVLAEDERETVYGEAADEIERLQRQKENLLETVRAKQARIDALMLEFCPGEMSAEQRAEWAKAQQSAPEPRVDLLAAIKSKAGEALDEWEACDTRACVHEIIEMIDKAPAQPPREG